MHPHEPKIPRNPSNSKFANKNGWKVSGIDPSSLAIDFAKQKLKLKNVKTSDYEDLIYEKKKYLR